MRPIKPKPRVARTASLQAPTDGLNARDSIADMKPQDAVTMDNWFPNPTSVNIRNGYYEHVTGFVSPIETLCIYNTGVVQKLFAVAGTGIYDVTTAGAVGAPVGAAVTNARWQTINIGTAGGFFLMMANGVDNMRLYDGTTWTTLTGVSTPAITGVSTDDIIHLNNFKNRVWMIEKDSFRAWYLPVSSIGGAANSLDLSGLFKLGGFLMAMCNWTIDNAAGIDDYAAFITSEGEVALYKGTDPSSSNTWAMVGTFRMGKPLGRRCFSKAGADVLVVTADGAFPLSKALLTDRSQLNLAATDKIQDLINADVNAYGSLFGWQPILYPIGNKLIINVPTTENVESHQYVMNTTHGAWCRFTGWNAFCFEELDDVLYFGGATAVYVADRGQSDNGSDITSVCQQAFSYFGDRGRQKRFTLARPVFTTEGDINPAILINTDFQQNRTTVAPSFTANVGSPWDTSPWDTSSWTQGDNLVHKWQTVTGIGFAAGIRVVTQTQNLSVRWNSTDFVFENGGIL